MSQSLILPTSSPIAVAFLVVYPSVQPPVRLLRASGPQAPKLSLIADEPCTSEAEETAQPEDPSSDVKDESVNPR